MWSCSTYIYGHEPRLKIGKTLDYKVTGILKGGAVVTNWIWWVGPPPSTACSGTTATPQHSSTALVIKSSFGLARVIAGRSTGACELVYGAFLFLRVCAVYCMFASAWQNPLGMLKTEVLF